MLGIGFGFTSPAVIGGGAAGPVAWTPLNLGASLKAWWSADDHGTARMVDDGAGLISSWTDKIGALAATGTTTARPTWAATSFNSAYAGLTFDGTANCLVSTVLTSLPTGATAGTIFMLLSNAGTSGVRNVLNYGGATAGTDRRVFRATGAVPSRLGISDGSTTLTDTVGAFDGAHIVVASWAGTTESARFDGADTTPATATAVTLATGAVRLRIGASSATSAVQFHLGVVSDAIITSALTLLEIQKLEGWGAWIKGLTARLPGGHPYKLAAP